MGAAGDVGGDGGAGGAARSGILPGGGGGVRRVGVEESFRGEKRELCAGREDGGVAG